MKKRVLLGLLLGFCLITTDYFSQVRVLSPEIQNLRNSSAFMDASSNTTLNSLSPNKGRGLIFPTTDLTTLALEYSRTNTRVRFTGDIPDLFDGMLVYNTVEGKAAIGGDSVYVGFYFYRNYSIQTGRGPRNLTNGKWVRVGTSVSGSNSFSKADNQQLTLANNMLSLTNGGTPVQVDTQKLRLNGSSLSIGGQNSVNLSAATTQNLSVNGGNLELSGSSATIPLTDLGSDTQKLSIVGTDLVISGGNSVPLTNLGSDTQKLRIVGNALSIGGKSIIV